MIVVMLAHAISPGVMFSPNGNGEPITESIDISVHDAKNFIEITSIDGIPIKQFSHLGITGVDIKTTGSGANVGLGIELSSDGGDTWLTTNEYHSAKEARAVRGSEVRDNMRLHDGASPTEGWAFLAEFHALDQVCPTFLTSQEMSSSAGSPLHFGNMSIGTEVVHDAIRLIIYEDVPDTTNFSTGTMELVGYRAKEQTEVHELSLTGETEFFVDIADGHTVVDIFTHDAVLSGSGLIVQTSVAGTEDNGASDYRNYHFGFTSTSVSSGVNFIGFTDAGTQIGFMEFWGLNTEGAQIAANGYRMAGNGLIVGSFRFATSARSQLRIATFDGVSTMDSGSIWIVSRKIKATVVASEDFNLANTINFPMISLKDSVMVFTLDTVTTASNTAIGIQTSADNGSSWHSADHRNMEVFGGGDTIGVSNPTQDLSMRPDQTSYVLASRFAGINLDIRMSKLWSFNMGTITTNNKNGSGFRETKEVIDALRVSGGTVVMDGGIFTAVSYKL